MNSIPLDILETAPALQAIHLPHTETVRMSPFRLRAMQAEVRKLLEADPIGPREKIVQLLGTIEEKYQRLECRMPDGLAELLLNVYAVILPGVDSILWPSQRIHRGVLDQKLIRSLLDTVAAIGVLAFDPVVGAQFCAVNDMLTEMMR